MGEREVKLGKQANLVTRFFPYRCRQTETYCTPPSHLPHQQTPPCPASSLLNISLSFPQHHHFTLEVNTAVSKPASGLRGRFDDGKREARRWRGDVAPRGITTVVKNKNIKGMRSGPYCTRAFCRFLPYLSPQPSTHYLFRLDVHVQMTTKARAVERRGYASFSHDSRQRGWSRSAKPREVFGIKVTNHSDAPTCLSSATPALPSTQQNKKCLKQK